MKTPFGELPFFDSHAHFFSFRFFQKLLDPIRDRYGAADPYATMGQQLGIELPEPAPEKLAARWVTELDRHGVERMFLMASMPSDEDSVAAAVRAYPKRFAGLFMVDPTQPGAADRVLRGVTELGLRGIALFPSMHHYHAWDDHLTPIYRIAAEHGVHVFVHFGLLRIAIRDRLGIASKFDLRFGNPLDLHKVAKEFPMVNFQVPHFGCGFFREVLMLGDLCGNVYVDTSSSNTWAAKQPHPLTLRDLFQRTLAVFGASRILLGTDSGMLPRGWRADVFAAQMGVLQDLSLTSDQAADMLGGNLTRLLEF